MFIQMVKNLFFSFLIFFSINSYCLVLTEYENFYEADGASVIETLKKIDEKLWIMESTAEHSLFNFYQKSVFYVENNQIYSTEMERRLRAFGGLRKENQKYLINHLTKEVEYTFNKKQGKFNFDHPLYGNLTLQLQLKFDLKRNDLPHTTDYLFLDKGKVKTKKFFTEIDTSNEESFPSFKVSEIRDDDREYYLWFKEDELLTTYKIFNDFGTRTATWRLTESKLSGE